MEDNAEECRQRLFDIWDKEYTANDKAQAYEQCREAVRFILRKNILCGDALTMLQADGSPIVFAEWSLVTLQDFPRSMRVRSLQLRGTGDYHRPLPCHNRRTTPQP